ncbi:MAG TPA: molybdopterin cofactor-binding domain-containing protein [Methylomirabilota bacterium]|nr:molybdopterin cofactor-binding domain-containing protein [Methylomirabilota bacterium]
MSHSDLLAHVRGTSRFVDDLPEPAGLLHGAAVTSPVPHARLGAVDTAPALALPGVLAVLTAADIPGANQIGGIVQDEELFATSAVHFVGQPVALVVAESARRARAAARACTLELEPLPAVFDPREAAARGDLITAARTLETGDVDAAWADCDVIVSGRADSAGQEHLYLETQAALAIPLESGRVKIISSTQAPTAVQRIAARVLGLPMNAVEVEVTRLGGAFGGKEDQATPWAVMAALAALHLDRPVKLVLSRHEDMVCTGKRHPYSSDFKLGLAADGRCVAYEVHLWQNAGAAADLSPAILERSMFHATGAYLVPNVRIHAASCRTNLPPFTAFRGFGAPQAMYVFEAALDRAAEVTGIPRTAIQARNLLDEGAPFPYGMRLEGARARRSWDEVERLAELEGLQKEVAAANAADPLVKRGVAAMPVCFGISFTNTTLNQAGALVHVYTDGSVSVSTGAVEMGQGVSAKILAVAAATLGLPRERIRIESTSTRTVANTSPTAASSGADMNGRAAELACRAILDRLLSVAAERLDAPFGELAVADGVVTVAGKASELGWDELVAAAYARRVNLSAQAHYATPGIWYDRESERGEPFAYHVFGTAVLEVTVDCLRGTYRVDRVRIVHDGGRSLDEAVDRGQLEGGLVQGLGWMTMEELVFAEGRNLSDTLSTYKIPDLPSTPVIEGHFLADADNPKAVLRSKAIGEPPFMYGIGVYFALLDALRAFRPDRSGFYDAPLTPEKALLFLHDDRRIGF